MLIDEFAGDRQMQGRFTKEFLQDVLGTNIVWQFDSIFHLSHPIEFTRMIYLDQLADQFPRLYERLLAAAIRHQSGKKLSAHPEPLDENDNHAGPAAINGEQEDSGGEETC